MSSFTRWNRRYHVIEVDLPGAPIRRKISIEVQFNGDDVIKRLQVDRYASDTGAVSPVKRFCSCPDGATATTVLAAGASGSCGEITGPTARADADMIILTPGFQRTDCRNMGPEFLPFDLWHTRETLFVDQPGGTNRSTSVWEITGPQTTDTIIITIVIEDNAEGSSPGSLPR